MDRANQCVYVVDDDAAVRKSFSLLMKSVGLKVVLCESAEAFLEKYDPRVVACLILDIRMPEMSGIELQQFLLQKKLQIPIIVVTANSDVSTAVESMHLGALDYVQKPFDHNQLISSVKQALQKDHEQKAVQEKIDRLTPRERQVMYSLLEGNSNKETAFSLGISVRTVEVHRAKIMDKLEVRSVAELLRMAIDCGII